MRCEELRHDLAEVAEGNVVLFGLERAHVETCGRCRDELVQQRTVLRTLRALRTELLEPAPGLVADVLASLEAAGERQAVHSILWNRRVAYVGGIAAATAAGVAGTVFVLARRGRARTASLAH
jgi:hypothetical protein